MCVRCCQILSDFVRFVRFCQVVSDTYVRFCQAVPDVARYDFACNDGLTPRALVQDPSQGPMCRTLAKAPCAIPMPSALVKDPAVPATAAATAKQDRESQGTQPIFDMNRIACRLLLLSASARKRALNRLGAGTRIHDVAQAPGDLDHDSGLSNNLIQVRHVSGKMMLCWRLRPRRRLEQAMRLRQCARMCRAGACISEHEI